MSPVLLLLQLQLLYPSPWQEDVCLLLTALNLLQKPYMAKMQKLEWPGDSKDINLLLQSLKVHLEESLPPQMHAKINLPCHIRYHIIYVLQMFRTDYIISCLKWFENGSVKWLQVMSCMFRKGKYFYFVCSCLFN